MAFGGRKRATSTVGLDARHRVDHYRDTYGCGGGCDGLPVTPPQDASDLIFLGDEFSDGDTDSEGTCDDRRHRRGNNSCTDRHFATRGADINIDVDITGMDSHSYNSQFSEPSPSAVTPVSSVGGGAWSGDAAGGGHMGKAARSGRLSPRRRAHSEHSSLDVHAAAGKLAAAARTKKRRRSRSSTTSQSSDFSAGFVGVGLEVMKGTSKVSVSGPLSPHAISERKITTNEQGGGVGGGDFDSNSAALHHVVSLLV